MTVCYDSDILIVTVCYDSDMVIVRKVRNAEQNGTYDFVREEEDRYLLAVQIKEQPGYVLIHQVFRAQSFEEI